MSSTTTSKRQPARRRALTTTLLAFGALAAAGIALPATASSAQPATPGQQASSSQWPTRPITLVVPFPAGGGTDLTVRTLQPLLQKELGQPVVVENKAGAGGTIGSAQVAKAAADGYTAVIATTSTHAVSVSVYPKLAYDPLKDFAYAGIIGTSPYVLAVNPSVPGNDLKSFITALKEKPDQYSFASVGAGTVSHLLGEQFKAHAGVPLVHIPYRGAAPAYTDLMGGQVQMLIDNPVGLAPSIRAGKLRALATTEATSLLDAVPTFAQQGVEGFTQTLWYGVAFPRSTPAAVIERFNAALNKALADPGVAADLAAKGIDARPGTAEKMRTTVEADISYWGEIARRVGAKNE